MAFAPTSALTTATTIDPEVSAAIGHTTRVYIERSSTQAAFNIRIVVEAPDGPVRLTASLTDQEAVAASQGLSRGFFSAIMAAWKHHCEEEARRRDRIAAMEGARRQALIDALPPSTPGCLPNDFWI